MKPKTIPRKHQDKYMTQMDDVANWAISTEVRTIYEKATKQEPSSQDTDRGRYNK